MCPAINGRAFCDDSSTDPEFEYPALNKPKESTNTNNTRIQENSLCACAWNSEHCRCCSDDENEEV